MTLAMNGTVGLATPTYTLGVEASLREAIGGMGPGDEIHLEAQAVQSLVCLMDELYQAVSVHASGCAACMALCAGELLAPDHTCR